MSFELFAQLRLSYTFSYIVKDPLLTMILCGSKVDVCCIGKSSSGLNSLFLAFHGTGRSPYNITSEKEFIQKNFILFTLFLLFSFPNECHLRLLPESKNKCRNEKHSCSCIFTFHSLVSLCSLVTVANNTRWEGERIINTR